MAGLEQLAFEKCFAFQSLLTFTGKLAVLVQLVKGLNLLVLLDEEVHRDLEHLLGFGGAAIDGYQLSRAQPTL